MPTKVESIAGDVDMEGMVELLRDLDEDELRQVLAGLPDIIVQKIHEYMSPIVEAKREAPPTPLLQAQELDHAYQERVHLKYLSDRLAQAVKDVEAGQSRYLVISMPPRAGKSHMCSINFPAWVLRKHPEWKIGMASFSPTVASGWGRTVRELIKDNTEILGINIKKDAGAVTEWQTEQKGGIVSRSAPGQSFTSMGFKVLIIDDIVKDFADAHSAVKRQAVWEWWLSNSRTRLEPPSLVIVVGTRWHQDDFIGRLLSAEHEGDPSQWEVIEFPAIALQDDVLGRTPGQPLYSPLLNETEEEALARWEDIKTGSGTYTWTALYQQQPSPSKGAIFDVDWWRYWTRNRAICSRDESGELDPNGRIILLEEDQLARARWLDSWDMAFKATDASDYVVGQRWAQISALKFLIHQVRKRMTFTQTLATVLEWADPHNPTAPYSDKVNERLVEDKANGTAVIDMLKRQVAGLIPINPSDSKEARARAVTPECESGNVIIPFPQDPGNEWVTDWLSEYREFPTGAHDDQVDAGTQALFRMRSPQQGSVTVPGRVTSLSTKRRGQVALQDRRIAR